MRGRVDYRTLILAFIRSLAWNGVNSNDVADEVALMLRKLGISIEWSDLGELGEKLTEIGVPRLYEVGDEPTEVQHEVPAG
jgi:hypothetical protein